MANAGSSTKPTYGYAWCHWCVNKSCEIVTRDIKGGETAAAVLGKFEAFTYLSKGKLRDPKTSGNINKPLFVVKIFGKNFWVALQLDFVAKSPATIGDNIDFHSCMAKIIENQVAGKIKNAASNLLIC
jgi:hypothetical protein